MLASFRSYKPSKIDFIGRNWGRMCLGVVTTYAHFRVDSCLVTPGYTTQIYNWFLFFLFVLTKWSLLFLFYLCALNGLLKSYLKRSKQHCLSTLLRSVQVIVACVLCVWYGTIAA